MKRKAKLFSAFLAVMLLSVAFSVPALAAGEKTGTTTLTAIVPDPSGTTCTVTFDPNGGTGVMASVTVNAGEEYPLPENSFYAPAGKEFNSWDKGLPGVKITIEGDTVITAQWKDAPDVPGEKTGTTTLTAIVPYPEGTTFTVSFDPNGGTGTMASVTVNAGEEYTLPANGFNAPAGKEFNGWDKGLPGAKITIEEDTVVTAQWKDAEEVQPKTCIVSFASNGGTGTMSPVTVEKGSEYILPANSFNAPSGKAFDKWDKGTVGEKITVNEDITVIAQWKDEEVTPPVPETCTVTFDAGGGTGSMTPVTVEKGAEYTLPANGFTAPSGKVFDKWDKGTVGTKVTVNTDVTVTAQWKDEGEPTPETCTVSFDANGGTGTMAPVTVEKGAEYSLPNNGFTAPENKEFDKWDLGTPGTKIMVNSDIVVKAQWKDKEPPAEEYIFTFTKLWQGDHEKSIDWVLYHSDGTVAHKKFNKTIISKNEWYYETTFTTDEDYYIIEVIPAGYQVRYENVGAHAGITDRCYNGGKIINYKVPKTGDTADLRLWISMVLVGISIVCCAAVFSRKKKRQD